MIISTSAISMNSERSYQKVESSVSMSVTSKAEDAIKLDLSDKSQGLLRQLKEGAAEQEKAKREEEAAKRQKQQKAMMSLAEKVKKNETKGQAPVQTQEDLELRLLRQILENLRNRGKDGKKAEKSEKRIEAFEERKAQSVSLQVNLGQSMGSLSIAGGAIRNQVSVGSGGGQVWTVQTVTSSFFSEQEVTAFSTVGKVCTADGRELNFGVSIEMSRSFVQETECYTEQNYTVTDPLVLNLDTNIANVKDMKFYFDLDADGTEEEISELGAGSGYLALDKNGWIDEADEVFSKLKVWTKDENGENVLLNLKEAEVGAIYLGSAATQFSLNNAETNETNALVRKTGVFLRENGTAGTVQHVDLVL